MKIMGLLFLSSLLTAPLAATDTLPSAAQPVQIETGGEWNAPMMAAEPAAARAWWQDEMNPASEADGICYRIRAYIFQRDDDHAPVLKGSTTCGPKQARAKDVVWPAVRLVPAK